jgi:hypothetical protein
MIDDDPTEEELQGVLTMGERLTPVVRAMARHVDGLPGGEVGVVLGKLVSGYIAGYDAEYREEMWLNFKQLVESLFDTHDIMPRRTKQ